MLPYFSKILVIPQVAIMKINKKKVSYKNIW
jgi:hypothetical protein